MQAKEFMIQAAQAQRELKLLKERIESCWENGTNTASHWGVVSGKSVPTSRVENAVVGSIDLTGKYRERAAECQKIVDHADALIAKIPQERFREVLIYFYMIGGKEYDKLSKVGKKMGYENPNSVYRTHGWALAELDKLLKEEQKDDNVRKE